MQQKRSAPAEPGTVRRTSKPQYFRIKDETTSKPRSMFGKRVLLVLICYAILMPVSLLLVAFLLPRHSTPETQDFVYQVGPDKDYWSRTVYAWETIRQGEIYYLNMTELAEYCDMSTTGDDIAIRYIVKSTGETVEFILGQSVAFVNGLQERTGGDAILRNGKVFVPLDFVNRCFDGLSATVDLQINKITVLREADEEGEPLIISFPYKPVATTSSIRFGDLDPDLQLQILIQNQPPAPEEPPADGTTEPAA